MDYAHPLKLSIVDVQRLTVEDIRRKDFTIDYGHLSPRERAHCSSWISHLGAVRRRIDLTVGVDAKELAERLNCISPRPETLSYPATPAPSISHNTAPYHTTAEKRLLREKEAYETLIQGGGQPSHPIEVGLKTLNKHGKYKDIILYWKSFRNCNLHPFTTQLGDWINFRNRQDQMREHYESQNRFSDYPEYVNERRRRHNLEGNADMRLDHIQQSGLDDWMEYQHFQLEECERLEEPLKEAKEKLDAAKKEVYKAGDSEFGDAFREIRSDCSEDSHSSENSDSSEDSDSSVSSHEPSEWCGLEHKLGKAHVATKYAERAVEFLKGLSKVAELHISKKFSESDQTKAASAMKHLENAKKKENTLQLRVNMLEAARALASIKKDLKLNKIMVDWIEQQKPLIAARYATSIHDAEGNNNQGLTKNTRSQNHSESSLLPHYKSSKLSGQRWLQLARSVLGLSHESEAPKPRARKQTHLHHIGHIIISGKSNQFPILEVCKRRSKRIKSLKEKRQARDREILPLHLTPPPPSDRAGLSSFKATTTTKKRPAESTKRQVQNKGKL